MQTEHDAYGKMVIARPMVKMDAWSNHVWHEIQNEMEEMENVSKHE